MKLKFFLFLLIVPSIISAKQLKDVYISITPKDCYADWVNVFDSYSVERYKVTIGSKINLPSHKENRITLKNTDIKNPDSMFLFKDGLLYDNKLHFYLFNYGNIEKFKNILKSNNIILSIKSKKTKTEKVKVEFPYTFNEKMKQWRNGITKLEKRYKYVDKEIPFYETIDYNVRNGHRAWENAQNQCQSKIAKDKQIIMIKRILVIIGILVGLYITFLIIKKVKNLIRIKIAQGKEKLKDIEKQKAEKRIRDIAEEESIRSSIKKSIDESKDDDLEELQNLINKAVAKGDSDTAQALLKILNNKKNK